MNTVLFLPHASEGWGRYCFHRCLSVHRGVPHIYPIISPSYNTPTGPLSFPGVPQSQLRHPHPRTGWGTPAWPGPGLDGVTPPPPSQDRDGVSLPLLGQHSMYLLRRGRYASCVHARGLSCRSFFTQDQNHLKQILFFLSLFVLCGSCVVTFVD